MRNQTDVIILCTGPSARQVKFDKLPYPIFGMNHAYKLAKLDYYGNFHQSLKDLPDHPIYHIKETMPEARVFTEWPCMLGEPIWCLPGFEFKTDVFKQGACAFRGSSVFTVFQVAYSLGYRKLFVVGMDAGAINNEYHAYPEERNEVLNAEDEAVYTGMIYGAERMLETMPADLVIYNCSKMSRIKCFPFFDISCLYS